MTLDVPRGHHLFSALALALAGLCFVLYPVLRPFSDEASMQGAAAFASTPWLVSHILAITAFIMLGLGLQAVAVGLDALRGTSWVDWGLPLYWVGTGFVIAFYGAETYGLHALGQAALNRQEASLLELAQAVRSGTGLLLFVMGFLAMAVAAIGLAVALRRSEQFGRWVGLPLALGMALYIPQFFWGQPLRVAHGVLLGWGCVWIACRACSRKFPSSSEDVSARQGEA